MEVGFPKILFCTDFSKGAANAFKFALKAAVNNHAQLFIMHVLPEADAQFWKGYVMEDGKDLEAKAHRALYKQVADEYLSKIPEGVECETVYRSGDAAQQIIEFAKERDISLVVMARPRPRFLRSFLYGSTASKVARLIPCPLLVVPAE